MTLAVITAAPAHAGDAPLEGLDAKRIAGMMGVQVSSLMSRAWRACLFDEPQKKWTIGDGRRRALALKAPRSTSVLLLVGRGVAAALGFAHVKTLHRWRSRHPSGLAGGPMIVVMPAPGDRFYRELPNRLEAARILGWVARETKVEAVCEECKVFVPHLPPDVGGRCSRCTDTRGYVARIRAAER